MPRQGWCRRSEYPPLRINSSSRSEIVRSSRLNAKLPGRLILEVVSLVDDQMLVVRADTRLPQLSESKSAWLTTTRWAASALRRARKRKHWLRC